MWTELIGAVWPIFDIQFFPAVVIVFTVATAFLILRIATQSTLLATIFTPAMVLGALASNYLFTMNYLGPMDDKDSNIVIAAAVGVVVAMLFMLLATSCVMGMSDRRRRKQSSRLAGSVRLNTPARST